MLPDFRTTRTHIKEAKAAKEQRKNKERTKKRCPKMSRDFARDMKEIGKIGECVAGTVAEVADLRNIKKEPSESLNRISPLLILSGQETETENGKVG